MPHDVLAVGQFRVDQVVSRTAAATNMTTGGVPLNEFGTALRFACTGDLDAVDAIPLIEAEDVGDGIPGALESSVDDVIDDPVDRAGCHPLQPIPVPAESFDDSATEFEESSETFLEAGENLLGDVPDDLTDLGSEVAPVGLAILRGSENVLRQVAEAGLEIAEITCA